MPSAKKSCDKVCYKSSICILIYVVIFIAVVVLPLLLSLLSSPLVIKHCDITIILWAISLFFLAIPLEKILLYKLEKIRSVVIQPFDKWAYYLCTILLVTGCLMVLIKAIYSCFESQVDYLWLF